MSFNFPDFFKVGTSYIASHAIARVEFKADGSAVVHTQTDNVTTTDEAEIFELKEFVSPEFVSPSPSSSGEPERRTGVLIPFPAPGVPSPLVTPALGTVTTDSPGGQTGAADSIADATGASDSTSAA